MTQSMVLAEGTLEINSTGAEQGVRNVKKELLGVRDSLNDIQKQSKGSILFGQKGIKGELMHASGEIKEFFKYGLVGIASGFLSPVVGGLISQLSEPIMDAGAQMLGLNKATDSVGDAIDRNKKKQDEFNKSINDALSAYRQLSKNGFTNPDQTLNRHENMTSGEKKKLDDYIAKERTAQKEASDAAEGLRKELDEKIAQRDRPKTNAIGGEIRGSLKLDEDAKAEAEIANLIRGIKHFKRLFEESLASVEEKKSEFNQQNLDRAGSRAAGSAATEADREKNEVTKRRSELQSQWEKEDRETLEITGTHGDAMKTQSQLTAERDKARAEAIAANDEFNRNKFDRERRNGTDNRGFNTRFDRDEQTGKAAFEGIEAYSRKIQEGSDKMTAEKAAKQRDEALKVLQEIRDLNRKDQNAKAAFQ